MSGFVDKPQGLCRALAFLQNLGRLLAMLKDWVLPKPPAAIGLLLLRGFRIETEKVWSDQFFINDFYE